MEASTKNKKKIPKSIHEMSKEMLQETLKKKRECNAKAQETVLKLCETNINEEWFLSNLQFINQCHFEDVTVERSITKICGYPMCDKQLQNVPPQQYHISTKYNKVFDITERKNFCSGVCYKSAMHVKEQLFTSPLWFRDQEKIPKYTVLKHVKSGEGEKDVNLEQKRGKDDGELKQNANVKVEQDEVDKGCRLGQDDEINADVNVEESKIDDNAILEQSKVEDEVKLEQNNAITDDFDKTAAELEEKCSKLSINDETVEQNNDVVAIDKEINDTVHKNLPTTMKQQQNKTKQPFQLTQKIENSILEWFTLETLFYLYGEQKLKDLFQDKASEIKQILNTKLSTAYPNKKIEKLLCFYELLDADLDRCSEVNTNLKPLPDYSILKEEGKTLEIKVKAFYHGQLEVKQTKEEKESQKEVETDSNPLYLPLIDAHTQMALRRKIILDKLNKVLLDLIHLFSTNFILQLSDVRNLVTTFKLSAHNITFKPTEWALVGLIITKLLSIKDKELATLLNLESSISQINFILAKYGLKENYLDNLLLKLTDYCYLIEKFDEINE